MYKEIREAQTIPIYRIGQEEYIRSFNDIINDELHYTLSDIELVKRVDVSEPNNLERKNYILNSYVYPDPDFYSTGGAVGIPATYNMSDKEFEFNPDADIPYDEEEDYGGQIYDAVYEDLTNIANQLLNRSAPINESEYDNTIADKIVSGFASEPTKDNYYKALNAISKLENDNRIDKDKYDECIKRIQQAYKKRPRG